MNHSSDARFCAVVYPLPHRIDICAGWIFPVYVTRSNLELDSRHDMLQDLSPGSG